MKQLEEIEGSGPAQLAQLMKVFGHNVEVDFMLATVTSPPPSLKIKLDNANLEPEGDDLIVCSHLTRRTEHINITSATANVSNGTIEYLDELKNGDRVIVAEISGGQTYIIFDRAVTY